MTDGVHVGPTIFYYCVCETVMWVLWVLLFFLIELPHKRHVNATSDEDRVKLATQTPRQLKPLFKPPWDLYCTDLIVEGSIVSDFWVGGRKSDSLTS